MDLYFDPEALAPESKPRTVIDPEEVVRWFGEGRSYQWICQEYERRYNLCGGPTFWDDVRRRIERGDVRLDALVPWAVRWEHRWAYALAMLHLETRRRAGSPLSEHEAARLAAWRENLSEGDLVVHYDATTDEGFSYVPRRPGVDEDQIREPGR